MKNSLSFLLTLFLLCEVSYQRTYYISCGNCIAKETNAFGNCTVEGNMFCC